MPTLTHFGSDRRRNVSEYITEDMGQTRTGVILLVTLPIIVGLCWFYLPYLSFHQISYFRTRAQFYTIEQ